MFEVMIENETNFKIKINLKNDFFVHYLNYLLILLNIKIKSLFMCEIKKTSLFPLKI